MLFIIPTKLPKQRSLLWRGYIDSITSLLGKGLPLYSPSRHQNWISQRRGCLLSSSTPVCPLRGVDFFIFNHNDKALHPFHFPIINMPFKTKVPPPLPPLKASRPPSHLPLLTQPSHKMWGTTHQGVLLYTKHIPKILPRFHSRLLFIFK